ncbi:hypothetical protein SCLCIDRAFT_1218960, partial [Scleroderma citrinum Foug A]
MALEGSRGMSLEKLAHQVLSRASEEPLPYGTHLCTGTFYVNSCALVYQRSNRNEPGL